MTGATAQRVLVFHPANVFGGAERTLVNLLENLPDGEFDIVLVADPAVFRQPKCQRFHALDDLGISNGFSSFKRALSDARTLTALARSEGCTVVLGMLHYGAIVSSLCRLFSLFRLRTIASPRTPSRDGIDFHVGTSGHAALRWRLLVRLFCIASSRVLVASHGLGQECVHGFGSAQSRIRIVPNCVSDAVLARAASARPVVRQSASPDRPWKIVSSGRLSPEKDYGTLIRAVDVLRRKLPVELEIFGSGTEEEALRALVSRLDLESIVRFSGFHSDPMQRIGDADVFVHTALFEGFGNVLLEAMACAVPLVATDCDFGPREIVRDGVNGCLVRRSDPEHLAQTIESLLVQPDQRLALVQTALRDVAEYSARRMAHGYGSVFRELY